MRSHLFLASFFLALLGGVACKDDDHADFGERCEPSGCAEGLSCYAGYCEEECVKTSDCQPVEGWQHECYAGQCQIRCDAQGNCPQTLATPLECITEWCAAIKDG